MKKIIVASNNNHKIEEIKEMLKDFSYEIIGLKEAGIEIDIEENGKTYMENVEVVNNRLVLKLKREDLKKYNIPDPYYEILLNELSDHNFYLDNNTDMVEMMLENFSFEKKKLYIAECQHLIDSLQNIINKK